MTELRPMISGSVVAMSLCDLYSSRHDKIIDIKGEGGVVLKSAGGAELLNEPYVPRAKAFNATVDPLLAERRQLSSPSDMPMSNFINCFSYAQRN